MEKEFQAQCDDFAAWNEEFEPCDDKERADLLMVVQGYKSLSLEHKRALKAWLDDAICGDA